MPRVACRLGGVKLFVLPPATEPVILQGSGTVDGVLFSRVDGGWEAHGKFLRRGDSVPGRDGILLVVPVFESELI